MNAEAVLSFLIIGVIFYFYYKIEKRRISDYFGNERSFTKAEKAQLTFYQNTYTPIPYDERLPAVQENGWELEDIAFTATYCIYSSAIPSKEQVESLQPGDLVKLKFIDERGGVERMWVEVLQEDSTLLKGTLQNDAFDENDLKVGKTIWFHPNHILTIEKGRQNERIL